jgi:hypothetical protein
MSKYHVNPATGNPGACTAVRGGCPFGDDDAHFTSLVAARSAYELSQAAFRRKRPSRPKKLDLPALYATAEQVLVPTMRYNLALDDKPTGSIVAKIHDFLPDRSYLVKTEKGLWHPILVKDSGEVSLGVLSHSTLAMEHRGHTEHYFTEVDPELRDKIESAVLELDEVSNEAAKLIHDGWRESRKREDGTYDSLLKSDDRGSIIDVALTPYEKLPKAWQDENVASARSALEAINSSKQYGGNEDTHVPEEIHFAWKERNDPKDPFPENYYALPAKEQAKDIMVLSKVLEVLYRDF